mmetsp:Transcript_68132/g.215686  ORF Transcript_68132/g.215686 Transcript_68132/m.215686 type:complete len:279 (+) Transcript_68132:1518-2354(+)
MHEAETGESDHRRRGLEDDVPPHSPEVEEAPEGPTVCARWVREEPAVCPCCFRRHADEQQDDVEERDDSHEEERREERPVDETQGDIQHGNEACGCHPQRAHSRTPIPREPCLVPGPGHAGRDLEAGLHDEYANAADASYDEVAREVVDRLAKLFLAEPHETCPQDHSGYGPRHQGGSQRILPGALVIHDVLGQGVHEGDVLRHHQAHCAWEVAPGSHDNLADKCGEKEHLQANGARHREGLPRRGEERQAEGDAQHDVHGGAKEDPGRTGEHGHHGP